jgi:hypothetical protein
MGLQFSSTYGGNRKPLTAKGGNKCIRRFGHTTPYEEIAITYFVMDGFCCERRWEYKQKSGLAAAFAGCGSVDQ